MGFRNRRVSNQPTHSSVANATASNDRHGPRRCYAEVAEAMGYMLGRRAAFVRFLCGIAFEREAWLFAGSDRGSEHAAVMHTLIQTARLVGGDPQAWLADVLARITGRAVHRLDERLHWNSTGGPARLAA